MRMYFEIEYERKGVICNGTMLERQTYYISDKENGKRIRANLIKILNFMGKNTGVYLRVGAEETVQDGKQRFAITQSVSDAENDVYSVIDLISKNERDERKVGASAIKKMIVAYFNSLSEKEVLVNE